MLEDSLIDATVGLVGGTVGLIGGMMLRDFRAAGGHCPQFLQLSLHLEYAMHDV